MNLYAEGILIAIQPKSNVPFRASGMDGYFNLCLGICHNRKFCCSSLFLFRTTLIRKFFLMLKQTSVIYKVPLCSYFCPLKLHSVSLIPLFFFYNSTEISRQLYYFILSYSIPLFLISSDPFTTLVTCLWTQFINVSLKNMVPRIELNPPSRCGLTNAACRAPWASATTG